MDFRKVYDFAGGLLLEIIETKKHVHALFLNYLALGESADYWRHNLFQAPVKSINQTNS